MRIGSDVIVAPARTASQRCCLKALVSSQGHRQRGHVVSLDDDEGPQKPVPAPIEIDDHGGEDEGPDHRHDDPRQDAEMIRSVDQRSVDVVIRDRRERLVEQENRERADGAGQDDSGVGIEESQAMDLQEEWDHHHLEGNHHQGQHQPEQIALSRDPHLRQRVRHERLKSRCSARLRPPPRWCCS